MRRSRRSRLRSPRSARASRSRRHSPRRARTRCSDAHPCPGRQRLLSTRAGRTRVRAALSAELDRHLPADRARPDAHARVLRAVRRHAGGTASDACRQRRQPPPRPGGARNVDELWPDLPVEKIRSVTSPTVCTCRPGWRPHIRGVLTAISARTSSRGPAIRRPGRPCATSPARSCGRHAAAARRADRDRQGPQRPGASAARRLRRLGARGDERRWMRTC